MLLLLSRFSRVQLFVTPWTAAYQAPPSVGFSRQECWRGLPLPSPIYMYICINLIHMYQLIYIYMYPRKHTYIC